MDDLALGEKPPQFVLHENTMKGVKSIAVRFRVYRNCSGIKIPTAATG
jgi:hypothetical protein